MESKDHWWRRTLLFFSSRTVQLVFPLAFSKGIFLFGWRKVGFYPEWVYILDSRLYRFEIGKERSREGLQPLRMLRQSVRQILTLKTIRFRFFAYRHPRVQSWSISFSPCVKELNARALSSFEFGEISRGMKTFSRSFSAFRGAREFRASPRHPLNHLRRAREVYFVFNIECSFPFSNDRRFFFFNQLHSNRNFEFTVEDSIFSFRPF